MNAFQKTITAYFDYYLRDVMTTIPGIVVSTSDIDRSIVAVKPALNEKTLDGRVYPWPEVVNVPLIFPCSSDSAITFPIREGDGVLLVFSMRGMDEWKGGDGGLSTPTDRRDHALQDAIAIPGLFPPNRSKNSSRQRTLPHSRNDLVFAHNIGTSREAEVRIDPAGKITMTSPLEVEVNSPITTFNSNVVLNGSHTVNGTFTYNGEEYSLHRHTGVQPGNGTSGPKA